jgi:hypothetical protein
VPKAATVKTLPNPLFLLILSQGTKVIATDRGITDETEATVLFRTCTAINDGVFFR